MERKSSVKITGQFSSRESRLKQGSDQRKHLSRSALGEFEPSKRKFKPLDVLAQAAEGRVASLLSEKYRRMAVSPFSFFRGAVSIMAADLASHPFTGLNVQLCGDAHVQNLGSFATPEGHLVFDINDFDETIAGPWEWDVKRMAASIVLAGTDSNHGRASNQRAVETFACNYCQTLQTLAGQPILIAARHQIHRLTKSQAVTAALDQAERAKPADLVQKYSEPDGRGEMRFKKIAHQLWRVLGQSRKNILESLPLYRQSLAPDRVHLFDFFHEKDVAFKIVGTGSVGLRDYVVLMEGNGPKDILFLQIKQELHSAYAPYLKHTHYDHQGRRVVEGQRRNQIVSDLLLGWTSIGDDDYLVRQLNDHKGSVDIMKLRGEGLDSLASVAGELLARGHCRSGDGLAIKGYIGSYEKIAKSIVKYAMRYAEVTNNDFAEFRKAIRDGAIKVAA